jgi:very-short-patch-repair endonuclease
VLAELGWISKDKKGWAVTPQGAALGAVQKEHNQTGVPYVWWPETILSNKALLSTVNSLTGEPVPSGGRKIKEDSSFREKYDTPYRATDGHWVRSKAEMLIDNWLYMSGVIHAYERQLPIEEDVFCDFYLPDGKVYIEYWGMERDPKYAARKKEKTEIYKKHNLQLIELTDEHVKNLDDHLPKVLLKYNVIVS